MTTSNATVHDPVCHMDINIQDAVGSSEYDGKTYYFCSPGCKKDFDSNPLAALAAEEDYDHSQPMDHGMMGSMASTGTGSGMTEGSKKPWWKFWG